MEKIKLNNKSNLIFTEIGSEKYRVYQFDNSFEIKIEYPLYLSVSATGGHRILDAKGISHYIPTGWKHLYWESFEGEPNFVK